MDKQLLQQMIDEKYVSRRKHPSAELYIYNYTAKAQYDWVWNDITRQCRGLIMDGDGNVVVKPFEKFFSLEQLGFTEQDCPNEPFEVFEKMDGSLGILYWVGDAPYIATRGSFESSQADTGTQILQRYKSIWDKLNRTQTYLFEIIAPSNKIVVDYGATEDLFLLTIIDTTTRAETIDESLGFPLPQRFDGINDLDTLKEIQDAKKEGFVVRFKNGFRLKVKFDEYKRLHKLVTQVSNVTIWEYLRDGKPFTELVEKVPDEFYTWLTNTKNSMVDEYGRIESECKSVFKDLGDRKSTALYFQEHPYPQVLFSMLDGKDYQPMIWKMVKPKWSSPFKEDEV